MFNGEDIQDYKKSWRKSLEATTKLFKFIKGMPPHEAKKTVSLNEARSFIIAITKPMAQTVDLIDRNSTEIEKARTQWKADDDEIQKVQERLHFKGFKLKRNHLNYPITVCTHQKCIAYQHIGKSKQQETLFPQICHDHCYLKGIPSETINNRQIYYCRAMAQGKCRHCRHDYRDHMHMTYTTSLVEVTFLSDDVQKEINDLKDVKDKKQKAIEELEKHNKENKEEKEVLYSCASHFGAFLKKNAMIPYNDSFSEYLNMQIKVEQTKQDGDNDRIAQLMEDKRVYEMKKKTIIESTSNPAHNQEKDIEIGKIYEMRDQLCSLKHNGLDLKEALGTNVNFSK